MTVCFRWNVEEFKKMTEARETAQTTAAAQGEYTALGWDSNPAAHYVLSV